MEELTQQVANLVAVFSNLAQNGQIGAQVGNGVAGETTANVTGTSLVESLRARMPMFVYEPDEDKTFDAWWIRYEDVLVKDGAKLSEDCRTRLLIDKLDSKSYQLYSNRILPKIPSEISFSDTIKLLQGLFKSTTSIFRKRQDFLRMEYTGNGIEEYTGKVLRGFTSSEFKKMTDEQICIMVWISGLRDESQQDIRTRALQIIELKPTITLLELEAEVKKLLDIKTDAKMMGQGESQHVEINAVAKKGKHPKPQKKEKQAQTSTKYCYCCGGNHWKSECGKKEVTCNFCKMKGHLEKLCRKKAKDGDTASTPRVKSIFVDAAHSVSANRIYKSVEINGQPITMLLDTGADVTLVSVDHWKEMGSPTLEKTTIKIKSANHEPIPVHGTFKCEFVLNGNKENGIAYVAETDTLLGTEWISKDRILWKHLQNSSNINSALSDTRSACERLRDVSPPDVSQL